MGKGSKVGELGPNLQLVYKDSGRDLTLRRAQGGKVNRFAFLW